MNIRKYRLDFGLTQAALAEMLHVDHTCIVKWEKGKAYPTVDKLIKLAGIFGCSVDELLGLNGVQGNA